LENFLKQNGVVFHSFAADPLVQVLDDALYGKLVKGLVVTMVILT
jgi:hypothetical protein